MRERHTRQAQRPLAYAALLIASVLIVAAGAVGTWRIAQSPGGALSAAAPR